MGAEVQPITTEQSPIRDGRLYYRELKLTHRIIITALNALTGEPSEISIVPVSIRPSSDKSTRDITFLFEGTTGGESFGFYKLGDRNEVYTIPTRSLIESHVGGHLVSPHDCRILSKEFIEEKRGWDVAFDFLRKEQIIPIAAHDVGSITYDLMRRPLKSPKTRGYLESLKRARAA